MFAEDGFILASVNKKYAFVLLKYPYEYLSFVFAGVGIGGHPSSPAPAAEGLFEYVGQVMVTLLGCSPLADPDHQFDVP